MRHAQQTRHSIRRAVGCGILAALTVLPGCYTYIPVESTTPPTGETVAFEISDQGRAGLSERLGSGVDRIEGRVRGTEGDQYLVDVFRIAQFQGGKSEWSTWSGETIRLDRGYVSRYQTRRLSKTRTWILAGGITGAIVLLAVTKSLTTLFQGEDDDDPGGDPPISRRVPLSQP